MDTTSPEIDFASYQSVFLFHAGSDRQNDIGFPETCNDLFTGFISFRDSVPVDNDSAAVRNALMMPETAVQDNRATALNAVMAHEFGHQLGLVDLYDTRNFMSQLGDFALMDNNGFGTGIDFSFDAGRVFGAIPLFPCAWSRAHLGFVDVHDFRQGTDIVIGAAQMLADGIKVARIPISENEYYLLENRLIEYDNVMTGVRQDSATNVILGPVQVLDVGGEFIAGDMTNEYDALMPGSGMLIYHIDEGVAGLDYNGDGENNFDDNQLQWDPFRKFVTLIEGDGVIDFGGYYRRGYGTPEDMYREDRNSSFTPNTNPPSIDNSGNNTHIRITGISRVIDTIGTTLTVRDSLMRFDVETAGLVENFPVRGGAPSIPLPPIAADLNRDGTDEIIFASDDRIMAVTTEGENFIRKFYSSPSAPLFYDSAFASVHPGREHVVPVYAELPSTITCGPVVGDFGEDTAMVAVGFSTGPVSGRVFVFKSSDNNDDAQGDYAPFVNTTSGVPVALTFGDVLYALTDNGTILLKRDRQPTQFENLGRFDNDEYHGICRAGDGLILVAGDENSTTWYGIRPDSTVDSISVDGRYNYGPIAVDVDRDDTLEIVGFSTDGDGIFVSVDPTTSPMTFAVRLQRSTGQAVTTNPVAADLDDDGYPDIILGGVDAITAFDRNLTQMTNFPKEVDDRYPGLDVIATPVIGDIERGGQPEVIVPTEWGNVYAWGRELAYGFPLSAGEIGAGSVVITRDSLGGVLGYLGADGWFYLWETDVDTTRNYWPMGGADASGALVFDDSRLADIAEFASAFDEDKFYNYPNPVTGGQTTIRYFLGREAVRVDLTVYDLAGSEVATLNGPTAGGVNNETTWNCSSITPGVYRCRLEVDFGGETATAFKDIAIIK